MLGAMARPRSSLSLSRGRLLRLGAGAALALAALPAAASADEHDEPPPDPIPGNPPADEPAPEPPPSEEPPPREEGGEPPVLEPEAPPEDTPATPVPFALLDGALLGEDELWINGRLPVAVIVDNLPSGARPQAGLDRADLVYELLVEGGITRFLAVFHHWDAPLVLPVRSVRTPYLYLVSELDAILAHVGAAELEGPADAGSQMWDWGIRHLEEGRQPFLFGRDRARVAPHNAYTATVWLRGFATDAGWPGPPAIAPWTFKEDWAAPNPSEGAGRISYGFAGPFPPQRAFAVEWHFDPASNSYARVMGGAWHVDARSGNVLSARNVVVQFDSAMIVDRDGHVLYGSTGSGPAYVFQDGQVVAATWHKPERTARTRYLDRNGDEVAFNRGPTWVSLLPFGSPFSWE